MAEQRPKLQQATDFNGASFTLPAGLDAWRFLGGSGRDLLLLGGSAEAAADPRLIEKNPHAKIRHIAASDQLPPETELASALQNCRVYFYKPALRMDPGQWGPVLARIDLFLAEMGQQIPAARSAWLPGNDFQLLHPELKHALANCGYSSVLEGCPGPQAKDLLQSWSNRPPGLAISVNFNGLDSQGHIFELCRRLEVPLAIWLVDNPWNLLSGIPLPWWREANIFVTDKSYIGELKKYGASHVWHLPLAASWHMFGQSGERRETPLFIGRSEFPAKKGFFAGVKLDPELLSRARQLQDKNADFHWWSEKYNLPLWPGKQERKIALGAEEISVLRKASWLKASLAATNLRIIGDNGWQKFLGPVEILPHVDYYGPLPQLYANAECVLNVTSLLLPESINQRHFDVWAAGGFLLSDATRGLEIFPADLVAASSCENPARMCERLVKKAYKNEIAKAWQEEISQNHRYEMRIREIERILLDQKQY